MLMNRYEILGFNTQVSNIFQVHRNNYAVQLRIRSIFKTDWVSRLLACPQLKSQQSNPSQCIEHLVCMPAINTWCMCTVQHWTTVCSLPSLYIAFTKLFKACWIHSGSVSGVKRSKFKQHSITVHNHCIRQINESTLVLFSHPMFITGRHIIHRYLKACHTKAKITKVLQTFFGWVWKKHSCAFI